MQELINQLLEHARGVWRFRRYALITAWIVAVLGWAVVMALPDVYQANARLFVDTKTALKPVLEGIALEQDVNAQLNLVRQSLLSNPQLQPVAEKVGIVDSTKMSPEERLRTLADMRDRVIISVTQAASQDASDREAGTIYAIEYRDPSRDRAIKVVEILQNELIENTLGGKRMGSETAQKFLEQQIQEYEKRLRDAEDRLAEFKKRNVGLMPTEQGGYFNALQTEMNAVSAAESQLALTLSRRDELERQLRGEAPIAAAAGIVTTGSDANASAGDTLTRINETQARLDELLLRFTDRHPDVIATRENLEALKRRREEEISALRRGDPNAAAVSGASRNPVYQSIQLQLNQANVEAASLRRSIANHQSRVAELRKMLDTMPQVEAEFARLNRDYDVTRANYTALVERLEKSRLTEDAATSGSVRFDVIEPPTSPFSPVAPKRALLVAAILVFAVGLGVAVAWALSQLRPVFSSSRSLAEFTGLPVLGAISATLMDVEQAIQRRAYWRYSGAMVALVGLAVMVIVLSRLGIRLNTGA